MEGLEIEFGWLSWLELESRSDVLEYLVGAGMFSYEGGSFLRKLSILTLLSILSRFMGPLRLALTLGLRSDTLEGLKLLGFLSKAEGLSAIITFSGNVTFSDLLSIGS